MSARRVCAIVSVPRIRGTSYQRSLIAVIPVSSCALLLVASLCAGQAAGAGFDGQPPLRADDERRHLFRPYSAVQLDYLGANYCENLLDSRLNITSYTHQGFDSNRSDAWHLQFPDDAARIVEALVWEDQYSGVARLESVRRIVKGILAAQVPGTRGYHFFRHRSAGKTFVIFDDSAEKKEGRLRVSMWGDEVQGDVSVGFRAQFDGAWLEQKDFTYADTPDQAATPAVARSPQYWNESPFVFTRAFSRPNQAVTFSGRYGLSDDDTPLEFSYESSQAEKLAITVGEPGKPIPVLTDAKTPGFIDYPDRKTHWRSDKDGDQSILAPNFNYFVLHKPATWACPGYSSALLVMWDGRPEAIELLAENGYGHVRVVYAATGAGVKGRVRLYPFHWVNQDDTEHVFRCADSFLATGRMIQNGFPSQQIVNAIPSGLAAGAYLLTKYKDPFARTAQARSAERRGLLPRSRKPGTHLCEKLPRGQGRGVDDLACPANGRRGVEIELRGVGEAPRGSHAVQRRRVRRRGVGRWLDPLQLHESGLDGVRGHRRRELPRSL